MALQSCLAQHQLPDRQLGGVIVQEKNLLHFRGFTRFRVYKSKPYALFSFWYRESTSVCARSQSS
jgi:hypothetical protein